MAEKHGIKKKMRYQDLSGRRFGRLTAIRRVENNAKNRVMYACRCDCGNERTVESVSLKTGNSKSCGCLQRERASETMRTHGLSGTTTYAIWCNMIARCTDIRNPAFKNYGGRGITVCKRWRDSFAEFLADMGKRPKGMTLDRSNNDLGYCKDNCCWRTMTEQQRNRRNNVRYPYNGRLRTIAEIAELIGLQPCTLRARIVLYRWDFHRAVTTPLRVRGRH